FRSFFDCESTPTMLYCRVHELYLRHIKLIEAGGEIFVGKSLVMLDTDHIKEYVFGTDKLKEIRGASSLLDRLNRVVMKRLAHEDSIEAEVIYANGGTGLFVVETDKAEEFVQKIQRAYRKLTAGGASITSVV